MDFQAVALTRDNLAEHFLNLQSKLQAKLSTTEILELTTAIATYNMVARILVALQITPET
jgi:alkylhydroperoxidase family enzyme